MILIVERQTDEKIYFSNILLMKKQCLWMMDDNDGWFSKAESK